MAITGFGTSYSVDGSDTFQSWINTTNALVSLVENSILTANTAGGTDVTTGNASLVGAFTVDDVIVGDSISGESGPLTVSSGLAITPSGASNFTATSDVSTSLLGTIALGSSTKTLTINSGTSTINGSNLSISANTTFTGTGTKFVTVNGTFNSTHLANMNDVVISGTVDLQDDVTASGDITTTGAINAASGSLIGPVSTTANRPTTQGAIQYNTNLQRFEGYNGSDWKRLDGMHVATTAPSETDLGDLWWDSATSTLSLYSDTLGWLEVMRDNGSDTKSLFKTVLDENSVSRNIIENWSNGTLVSIASSVSFTPKSTESIVSNFPTVAAGITLRRNDATVYKFAGTATSAEYADIAERYASDKVYMPGTVVKIGGSHEITQTTTANDIEVFGVISTAPALEMNAGAGSNETHPFVALSGRVPCYVVGKVSKGQRLVSSDIPGHAIAATDTSDYRTIIGRALETKSNEEPGTVEVVVGVK